MTATPKTFDTNRVLQIAIPLALGGWVGVALGLAWAPHAIYSAYLIAFSMTAATVVGGLIFLMITYVVGARWNVVLRPLNEAIVRVIPLLPLLFLPLCFGLPELYPWARAQLNLDEHALALLEHKRGYLNPVFFWARSGAYFAVWIAAALLLAPRTPEHSPSAQPDSDVHATKRGLAAALLPATAVCLTFAAFDWLMSLDPFWSSSVFGVYYFAGGFVASFGLLAVMAQQGLRSGTLSELVGPAHFHGLGRLMFGFSIFWAYIAFFQALLIRMANRPDEVSFYARRLGAGWDVLLGVMVAARFVLPFALLLPRSVKLRPGFVAGCGALIVVGQYLDVFWLVAPERVGAAPVPGVWDLAALLAVVGTAVSFVAWRIRGKAAVPIADPHLQHSIVYRSPQ